MYERNAIVLERYFNQMFGYHMKNNIKTNFKDYCELVECLEKYKNISEEEENIMQEYDSIANKIREIQKNEETLNKKISKYQEERENLFQNIDENAEMIQKKLSTVNNNIENINKEIKENAQQFVDIIAEFSEKSQIRTTCERSRRNIENQYNKKLNETLDNYKDIDINFEKKAKRFMEMETEQIEKELIEKIKKNGEQEKIPFNTNVITKAITLTIYIQKRETEILTGIYEKTNKLFIEIKNNTVKNDKHNKVIQDSKCKLEFIAAIKEYLIQFLDNERLTAVNGEEEHTKLMEEACNNLEEDLEQINNLYTLLLKEISKKITKKSYSELYHLDYLKALETKSKEFEEEIKKLNLPVTIINPNYWRIEGMKKIYDVFYQCVTEEYGRDLSEYMPIEKLEEAFPNTKTEGAKIKKEKQETKKTEQQEETNSIIDEYEIKDTRTEIDKKIDMILGFDDEDDFEDDDWDEEDISEEDEDDWEEDDQEEEEEDDTDEDWEDDNTEEEDDDWEEDDTEEEDWEEDTEEEEEDENWEEDDTEEDEDWEDDTEEEEDDWEENEKKKQKPKNQKSRKINRKKKDDEEEEFQREIDYILKSQKNNEQEDSWENQFIRINKKNDNKKKKGFFDKFKK